MAEPDLELFEHAKAVACHAYTPFSRFPVGAAVRVESDEIVTGVNVDNASYPMTACAERGAISTAVALGHSKLVGFAVYGEAYSMSPCGGCRQVIAEHAEGSMAVTMRWRGELVAVSIDDLLPYPFQLDIGEV